MICDVGRSEDLWPGLGEDKKEESDQMVKDEDTFLMNLDFPSSPYAEMICHLKEVGKFDDEGDDISYFNQHSGSVKQEMAMPDDSVMLFGFPINKPEAVIQEEKAPASHFSDNINEPQCQLTRNNIQGYGVSNPSNMNEFSTMPLMESICEQNHNQIYDLNDPFFEYLPFSCNDQSEMDCFSTMNYHSDELNAYENGHLEGVNQKELRMVCSVLSMGSTSSDLSINENYVEDCNPSIVEDFPQQCFPFNEPDTNIDENQKIQTALQNLCQHTSEADLPEGLMEVTLMKHQRIALSWMVERESSNSACCGGILADDQGLGKTISTIALILKERPPQQESVPKTQNFTILNLDEDEEISSEKKQVPDGKPACGTLIVCPASVVRQWEDELKRKVTNEAKLNVLVYHGSNRTKDPIELAKYDVVITTYSIIGREVPKQPLVDDETREFCVRKRKFSSEDSVSKKRKKQSDELSRFLPGPLAKVLWFRVVLDEAQSIKNRWTKITRACWGLRARRRWCLSGTPIQNKIEDLFSYLRFLRHNPYGDWNTFRMNIKEPLQKKPSDGFRCLRTLLNTILLRRTKGTLLDGEPIITIPPKTINLNRVDFSDAERDFYTRLELNSRAQFQVYTDAGTVHQNYASIIVMLLRLRQACSHPRLVRTAFSESECQDSDKKSNKVESSTICAICEDPPENSVVSNCGHLFCNECIRQHLNGEDNHCPYPKCKTKLDHSFISKTMHDSESISEVVSSSDYSSSSSKIRAALEYLNSIKDGEKALVFSQWTGMLDLIEHSLKKTSIQYRRLDGTMSISSRDKAVKEFNTLPEVSVMLMSLKAASLGLNMVSACHVLLMDLWWNPTTEDQAIDRAHRIGQTRPVNVLRLTVKDTVEDRILAIQEGKRKMVATAFGDDGAGGGNNRLTVEELKYLFSDRIVHVENRVDDNHKLI